MLHLLSYTPVISEVVPHTCCYTEDSQPVRTKDFQAEGHRSALEAFLCFFFSNSYVRHFKMYVCVQCLMGDCWQSYRCCILPLGGSP